MCVYRYKIIIIISFHPLTFRRVKPVLFTTFEFNACKKYTLICAYVRGSHYLLFLIKKKILPPMTKTIFRELYKKKIYMK